MLMLHIAVQLVDFYSLHDKASFLEKVDLVSSNKDVNLPEKLQFLVK